ncbi:MAG: glycosyltransferase family 2 protein [Candidatus Omnitrophica bacterium]|nr:glycosyltransferase family 2 protein [Candidatus Omnitrophota bacterium]
MDKVDISVVIPVYDEAENIPVLYQSLKAVMEKLRKSYEIIYVDDGSTDSSAAILRGLSDKDNRVKAVIFRRNYGQTAALDAGIKAAKGSVIVTMDGDLQNDPEDIPFLLEKIYNKGYDVVSGWRYNRKDSALRWLLSRLAYLFRRMLLSDRVHDSGCTLKAYRKECFEGVALYAQMHRFIPAILTWKGFRVTEIRVRHHPRKKGKTKYNLSRLAKGVLDALVLRFWIRYSAQPIHFFGIFGFILLSAGFASGAYLSFIKLFYNIPIAGRPLLFLTVIMLVVGVQFIFFGIIADMIAQVYYGLNQRQSYSIKERIG